MHLIYLLIRATSILKNDKNRLNKIGMNNNKPKWIDIIYNNNSDKFNLIKLNDNYINILKIIIYIS